MGLDLRFPIGLMFSLIGLLLTAYGLGTNGDSEMYAPSLQVNINFWWGIGLMIFGALMLIPAMCKAVTQKK